MSRKCTVCSRDPAAWNNDTCECSHVDCPHRRTAWSERPSPESLFKGPWARNKDEDPVPPDKVRREP